MRHIDERSRSGERPDQGCDQISQGRRRYCRRVQIEARDRIQLAARRSHSLGVLTELIEGASKPNCGYLIDAYHFTRSGAGGRGFESVPADKIFCFQYSDLSPNPVTGVRRPTDRLPPGKGVVKWREMLGLLAEKEYTGYLSYEAPNPDQWARSPYDVASEGVELTRQLLRDAVPTYVS